MAVDVIALSPAQFWSERAGLKLANGKAEAALIKDSRQKNTAYAKLPSYLIELSKIWK